LKPDHKQTKACLLIQSFWSEKIIKETLARTGSQPFNIEDVQAVVNDWV